MVSYFLSQQTRHESIKVFETTLWECELIRLAYDKRKYFGISGILIFSTVRLSLLYPGVNNYICDSNSSCLLHRAVILLLLGICFPSYTGVPPKLHWGVSKVTWGASPLTLECLPTGRYITVNLEAHQCNLGDIQI